METVKENLMTRVDPATCTHDSNWYLDKPDAPVAENNPWLCGTCHEPVQVDEYGTAQLRSDMEPEQPEDVARTELDVGLELIGHADALVTGSTDQDSAMRKAQLHLLGSIATSLYEMKLMAAHIYEVYAYPRQVVLGDKNTCTCEPVVRQDAQGTYIPFDGTEDRIRDDLCPVHGVTVDKEQ